jgi:Peptidase family M1 domain
MKRINHRGHRERPEWEKDFVSPPLLLALCVKCSLVLFLAALLASSTAAQAQTRQPISTEKHSRYQIKLALDFDGRAYTGTERVRFVNRGEHPTSTLYFHLYPNVRVPGYAAPAAPVKAETGQPTSDEPRLEITNVRSASDGSVLMYDLDDLETTLRVNLREPVAPNAATEVEIKFRGSVPEIDPEETGLMTHVMQQVSAALRGARELRRPRDTNFRCGGELLLSSFYPVLAARTGDDWLRKVELSIGDTAMTEVADYEVTVAVPRSVAVYAPVAGQTATPKEELTSTTFAADNLRDFAVIAGRDLHSEQRSVGDVTIRSIFKPEHEVVARRVLNMATDAVRIYSERLGSLPMKTVSLVDAPLVATLGTAEFAGLGIIASAFYLDFDSPTMRNMPDVIREQRGSVEGSLEWTVAHVVAHQWWGVTVGNDPAREPILDEALANWSALLYYREAHGDQQAADAMDEQLRGVYRVYRTFGGEDMEASRAAREYRNSFQYAAIVTSKGALLFEALRKLLGDEKFFAALNGYYQTNQLEVADMNDLRGAFVAEAPAEQRRVVTRTFDRWLYSKHGDEDIGPPDAKLAEELGLPPRFGNAKGDKSVFTAFAKVGKFFWQQMTRIR